MSGLISCIHKSRSLSVYLPLCLSLFVSLSFSVSLCLSVSFSLLLFGHPLSSRCLILFHVFISLCLSLVLCHGLPINLSVCLSVCLSVSVSVSLSCYLIILFFYDILFHLLICLYISLHPFSLLSILWLYSCFFYFFSTFDMLSFFHGVGFSLNLQIHLNLYSPKPEKLGKI